MLSKCIYLFSSPLLPSFSHVYARAPSLRFGRLHSRRQRALAGASRYWSEPRSMMLLDRHADTMLMHGFLFELSPDADDEDQANKPFTDPKKLDHHVDTMLLLISI